MRYSNSITTSNQSVYLVITDNITNSEFCRIEIDPADVKLVSEYHWSPRIGQTLYVKNGKTDNYLHRLLLGLVAGDGKIADHIDQNSLNCKRSNLRIVNSTQSNVNRGKRHDNTSGYIGVSWNRSARKWQAIIGSAHKKQHLGLFSVPEDAAMAYNDAAIRLFGEYAVLNTTN